jgi:hypothetical protein
MNTDLSEKIRLIKIQSYLLAKFVKRVLVVSKSRRFLETIYTPFLAFNMQKIEWIDLCDQKERIFRNFDDLFAHINSGSELYRRDTKVLEQNFLFPGGVYDLTQDRSLNIYEKVIYKLFGISFLEIKKRESQEIVELRPDFTARHKLAKLVMRYRNIFIDDNLVNYLPISLFEALNYPEQPISYPAARVHWLGNVYSEEYLFYLAHLREKRSRIIGEPHGGMFCQLKSPPENEIAESILSDVYLKPTWELHSKAHPSTRVSRNLFISARNFRLTGKKKKMLVILPYFFLGREPIYNKAFYGEIKANDFHIERLRELKNHFAGELDLKLHPVQSKFHSSKIDYLTNLFPSARIVNEGLSQNVGHGYTAVIYLNATSTSIIELSATQIPQFVYLGPEQRLNDDYESFLWRTRKSSTREDYARGAWIEVDNRCYRSAYGASYFYPFYYAILINKLRCSP